MVNKTSCVKIIANIMKTEWAMFVITKLCLFAVQRKGGLNFNDLKRFIN